MAAIRMVVDKVQDQYLLAIQEKEMYFEQLIKAKEQQAKMLDEANCVHEEAKSKLDLAERIQKEASLTQTDGEPKKISPEGRNSQPVNSRPKASGQSFLDLIDAPGERDSPFSSDFFRMGTEVPSGVLTSRQAHENGCTVLDFSPVGSVLATGGNDSCIRVWDVARS